MRLEEQLAIVAAGGVDKNFMETLTRAAYFHGHICPGLAMGVLASLAFLDGEKPSEDEELVAVVETKACGIDAVQVLTGCTFGKGNLVFRDHGKSVFTFYRRETGKGTRFALRNIMPAMEEDGAGELFAKVRAGSASAAERERFQELWARRTVKILGMGTDIFSVTGASEPVPEKAHIVETLTCSRCGENMGASWVVQRGDESLCIPCAEK